MEIDFNSPLFIIQLFSGIIFLITGILTKWRPPRQINSPFGYRSRRSMQSQKHWDFAQLYFAKKSKKVGYLMLVISLIGLIIPIYNLLEIALALFILIMLVYYLFKTVERAIEKNFIIREKDN